MKLFIFTVLVFQLQTLRSQELFVFTEPASNMAAKSFGIRLNNYLMEEAATKKTDYHLLPELMWAASKQMMIHVEGFLSNRNKGFVAEGMSIYAKYRLYTEDDVHTHFRMGVFAKYSFNNSDIHQPAIDLNGHNSGFEAGLVATKLINRIAISGSTCFLHALDNGKEKFLYGPGNRNALNYTLSAGKLMLPKEYTSYKQTNMNLMVELLGQSNLKTGNTYLDMAPSVQFIFNSRLRVDVGYRYALIKKLERTSPNGFLFRLEYNFFNVY